MLATLIGKDIYVSHYPAGKSKFNPIEHSLFSIISINLAGVPIEIVELLANLINNTKTTTGLNVECSIDNNTYELNSRLFYNDERENIPITFREHTLKNLNYIIHA